jgi:DnaJ-class molecular chaperone
MPINYYIILGIPSKSSQEEIKSAYRRLAKEFHPDHYGENHSPFLNVQEAYSVLSDPVRRRAYDAALENNRRKHKHYRQPEPMGRQYKDEVEPLIPEKGPVDLDDATLAKSFQVYRPSLEALFDRFFSNFSESERTKGERPENLSVVITLTPIQAFRGGHVRLYVPAQVQCPRCYGRGSIGHYECWRCSGAGKLTGEYPIMINYPPGISDNHTVQISLDRYGIHNFYMTIRFRISETGL